MKKRKRDSKGRFLSNKKKTQNQYSQEPIIDWEATKQMEEDNKRKKEYDKITERLLIIAVIVTIIDCFLLFYMYTS